MRTRITIEFNIDADDIEEVVHGAMEKLVTDYGYGYMLTSGKQDDLQFFHYEVRSN